MTKSGRKSIKRVFHPYDLWEEYHAGMWRITSGDVRISHVRDAANLMRDPSAFKAAMMRAVDTWPFSCENNLTCTSMNRIAWLGHAGCCLGVGSPEDCTRLGWHTLNQPEQDEANRVAAEVLAVWEERYLGWVNA